MYSEMVYFEGAHFAHIACYLEHLRLAKARQAAARFLTGARRRHMLVHA